MKPFKILFTLSLLLLGFALKGAAPLYTTVNKIKYLCVFENATVVGHDYDLMGITIVPKVTVDCKDYYVDKIDSNALEYVHSPYIDIPEGIKEIGDYAFRDCDIYSLFLPNSLEKIGYCAFMDNKIDEVCFGEGIKEIEEYAFGGYVDKVSYASVESACNIILGSENMFGKHTVKINREIIFDLVVPDAVSEIKNYIFQKAKISTLKLSDSVKRIGVKSFAASELRTVDLGNGINSIDDKTFADCKSLYEVSFGNSLKKIGTESFKGCTALTKVVLPESLVEIGPWAFQDCSNMTSVFIPKSVQYFGYASFSYCGSLQTVEIENGVTFIPGGCFAGCENLSTITLPETLTSIEKIAFQDCI